MLYFWCLVTARYCRCSSYERSLIRPFMNILTTHSQNKRLLYSAAPVWKRSAQITHLFTGIINVLTRNVAPPTVTVPTNELTPSPEEWSLSKTPLCLFIVLSQRPCANGSRGGLCCVGCRLHKISACGAAHKPTTGNHRLRLELAYIF